MIFRVIIPVSSLFIPRQRYGKGIYKLYFNIPLLQVPITPLYKWVSNFVDGKQQFEFDPDVTDALYEIEVKDDAEVSIVHVCTGNLTVSCRLNTNYNILLLLFWSVLSQRSEVLLYLILQYSIN